MGKSFGGGVELTTAARIADRKRSMATDNNIVGTWISSLPRSRDTVNCGVDPPGVDKI